MGPIHPQAGQSIVNQLIGGAPAAPVSIIDTTTETFMADVIDASMTVPVIVDFWAPWCGPCKQLGPILEKVVKAVNGAVKLVKMNIDEHPEIAGQLRVQSIPAVFAFKDGRPVDAFVGLQSESQVKAFIQRLAGKAAQAQPSPVDEALAVAKQAMADGDIASAENIYKQVVQRQPENAPALVGLARCALAAGDLDDAKRIAAKIPAAEAKSADVTSLQAALELAEAAEKSKGATGELERRIAADSNDHEARLELAGALFAGGFRQEAIDHLLESFRRDRQWNEQAARKQLVKLFEAMGPTDPLTVQSRKRLSSLMFA
ncbi:MAG TPA: thioredoxin [Stellaceae bacterium]|nr:thioredoxin [Stellaceae bacterium]